MPRLKKEEEALAARKAARGGKAQQEAEAVAGWPADGFTQAGRPRNAWDGRHGMGGMPGWAACGWDGYGEDCGIVSDRGQAVLQT